MSKAIVGIYRHNQRANQGKGQSTLSKTIELDEDLKVLVRRRGWKSEVMQKVQEEVGEGVNVLAVSLVKEGADLEVNIAVTVADTPPRFGERRRPATVGGRKVGGGPLKTGKTMAAKRRSGLR